MNDNNIAFICDDNYVFPAQIAIKSLISNKKDTADYTINVIGVNLSDSNKKNLEKLNTAGVKINLINKDDEFSNIKRFHPYISNASLFKFQLAEIFKDLDKLLYLDCDILIQDDLSELFSMNIDDVYAAVTKDHFGKKLNYDKAIGVENYFNSGVMLLNLKKMRKDNAYEKLLKAKQNDTLNQCVDQHALNQVFYKQVKFLSPAYNCMTVNFEFFEDEEVAEFYDLTIEEYQKIKNAPIIVHLTNGLKPWNDSSAPLSSEFWQYCSHQDILTFVKKFYLNKENEGKYLYQKLNELEKIIKKIQKRSFRYFLQKLQHKLFYKKKNGKKKFKLLGIKVASFRHKNNKNIFKILGLKFSFKDKVDNRGVVVQKLQRKESVAPIHDSINDYLPVFNKKGFEVKRKDNKIIINNNRLKIEGEADNTLWTAASVLCNDEYSFNTNKKYVMFDIGLNLGITSLHKAQEDNCVKIYGFEPFAPTFKLAQRNLELNPSLAQKIKIFNYGLGEENKKLNINYNAALPGSMSTVKNIFENTQDIETVEIKQASKILKRLFDQHSEDIFLKIDCEGAEKEILPEIDKAGLLKKVKIIIMEWHYENPQWIVELLNKNNFVVFCTHTVINELGMIRAYKK